MSEPQFLYDKSHLPSGPWLNEPDRYLWKDEKTGYHCLIKRNPRMGILCGYVAIPRNHPCFGKDESDIDVNVHGGLTYAKECDNDPITGICHQSEDGDHVWWVGFDCGHYKDINPQLKDILNFADMQYRDFEYVKNECVDLAEQLKDLES